MPDFVHGSDEQGSPADPEPDPDVTMDVIDVPDLPESAWLAIFGRAAEVVAAGGGEELDDLVREPVLANGDDSDVDGDLDADHLADVSRSEEPFDHREGEELDTWEEVDTDAPMPDPGDVNDF